MAFASKIPSSSIEPEDAPELLKRKMKYNALSQIPAGVIVKGDVSGYIDCQLEDLGSLVIHSQLSLFCGDDKKIKSEYSIIEKNKLHNAVYFLKEFIEEHIRIILSRVHGDKMYLEPTNDITPKAIHVVTDFCNVGEVPVL